MRINCPLCGPRDRREFYYYGSADYLDRPGAGALPEAWDNYLHLRNNPAGETRDLWYHDLGCSSWLELTRNTVTHEVSSVRMVAPVSAAAVVPATGSEGAVNAAAPRKRPAKTGAEKKT